MSSNFFFETGNCQLSTVNCQLPTAQLPTAQLPTANCQLPRGVTRHATASCQLPRGVPWRDANNYSLFTSHYSLVIVINNRGSYGRTDGRTDGRKSAAIGDHPAASHCLHFRLRSSHRPPGASLRALSSPLRASTLGGR